MVDKSLVSRQEAKIRELETKLEFEKTQVKRLEVSGQDKRSVCVMLFCEKVSLQIIRGKKSSFIVESVKNMSVCEYTVMYT